jgi:hypothetical protein
MIADGEFPGKDGKNIRNGQVFHLEEKMEECTPDTGPVPGKIVLQPDLDDSFDLMWRSHTEVIPPSLYNIFVFFPASSSALLL